MNSGTMVGEIATEGADVKKVRTATYWRWSAFEWTGDISGVAALCLSVYVIFFGGPWQAPVIAAAYWLSVEAVMHLWIWHLRREGDRLREALAAWDEKAAADERVLRANRAYILHMELLIKAKQLHTADMRVELERLKAEQRERLIEQGRQEERARLGLEYARVRANQLELMANQLDIRAEQLEARRDQVKVMRAVRELQESIEDKIHKAYESGFIHGAQRASFVSRSGPRLTLVNPSA